MTRFDRFIMVDWSSGNDTGPKPKKDAIWLSENGNQAEYLRNRQLAEKRLDQAIRDALSANERLMIGLDFPFGYPAGFAEALTGTAHPFAVWDWLEARLEDQPKSNSRFALADRINSLFPGIGPFWFNGLRKQEFEHLPRKDTRTGHGMADRRRCEMDAKGAFTCWQMGGAGAVGGQVFTGMPVLSRLRQRFEENVAVWPFDDLDKEIVFVEIWPGLINPVVKEAEAQGGIRDAHQVQLLAKALTALTDAQMTRMLDVSAPEEGWIFGLGFEQELMDAARTEVSSRKGYEAAGLRPPPLRNDCFALPAGVDWTPVDDALAMLRDRLHTVVGQQDVALADACGRVLAADLLAKRANPPHPNTAVDGYGFAHKAMVEGDNVLPLVQGRSAAGVPYDGTVPEGHAIRVLTGADLPDGVDTVVLDEDCSADGTQVAFRGGLRRGANTRKAGEDMAVGQVAIPAGTTLRPPELALAASVGHGRVPVFERLRVAVLSTGDELVEAGAKAGAGQVYDANRPMLCSLAEAWGYEAVDMGRAPDDRDALRAILNDAATKADVILTSGGASAGDEDHMSALLREAGAMQEWRIALKPGRPLALGMWNGVPVFGLPGNPVAAFVCSLIFARPAMSALSGAGWVAPEGFDVPAAFTKRKKSGRREYLRARLRNGKAEVFASEGSGRVSGLSWAEGLVEIGDEAAEIAEGDLVRFIPYGSFGL